MGNIQNIGIAGTGAIGAKVARALDQGDIPGFHLAGVAASSQARSDELNATLSKPAPFMSFGDLARECDWILECLPPAQFVDLARPVLSAGKTLIVLSCSQLLEHPNLISYAQEQGARIVVPSGAMLGLDALKAAAVGEIQSVVIETRKPVAGLIKAPYLAKAGIDLAGITEAVRVIEGSVTEVAREFPANVNVAAALSLAGIGPDRTRMEVWADSTLERNTHTVRVTSDSSDFTVAIQGRPSLDNPATGLITPLSVIALLRNQSATLQVGT
ncbi:L-aspartate dehydrogenase [Roseovarius albus]|uniref:L-aspartate dehydrogenase n=1 Tax=Roseovarius albus TaxID=1247867 RepID=A0A1X7A414_9RHOB|nr:aspartate dehydrogenase [Roseovarius albus]SLN69918.1 L-aspartate dehydrogenase [Roseovarius albus]